MTVPTDNRDIEARLIAALTDTARRNLSDAAPAPAFRPDSSSGQPGGNTGAWVVVGVAAAIVVAVIAALMLPSRAPHSASPAHGSGTYVVLRAHTEGLSTAELAKAQQVISARAASLGAKNPDVRLVGSDEITVFLPGVAPGSVDDLGIAGELKIRPVLNYPAAWANPHTWPPVTDPQVVDPLKSLGFAAPKDDVAYNRLSESEQSAMRAVVDDWDCRNLPADRDGAPIVTCSQDGSRKYLLGPTIVTSDQLNLVSIPVTGSVAGAQWRIAENLGQVGYARLAEYAAWHGGWQYNGHLVGNVAYGFADFALTLDGVVLGETYVTQPIDTTVYAETGQHFDQVSTMRLTGYLDAGQLPARFDVISIQGR